MQDQSLSLGTTLTLHRSLAGQCHYPSNTVWLLRQHSRSKDQDAPVDKNTHVLSLPLSNHRLL